MEAAERDKTWGIGTREEWGQNLLGKIFMNFRDELLERETAQVRASIE